MRIIMAADRIIMVARSADGRTQNEWSNAQNPKFKSDNLVK